MSSSLQGCLPVSLNNNQEHELKLLCSTDAGYHLLESTGPERRAYDHLAAAQASEDNYSPYADFIATLYDQSGIEVDANLNSDTGVMHLNGERVRSNAGAALIYAALNNGEIEWLEEAEDSPRELGIEIELPDEENWLEPDPDEITVDQDLEEGEYDIGVSYERYDIRDCQNPSCSAPHPRMVFEPVYEEELVADIPDNSGQVPGNQFRREMKRKVLNGEFQKGANISPASVIAYPEDDISLDEIEEFDIAALSCRILEETGLNVKNIMEPGASGKNFFSLIGDQVTQIPVEIFASMYPTVTEEVYVNDDDLMQGSRSF